MSKKAPAIIELSASQLEEAQGGVTRPTLRATDLTGVSNVLVGAFDPISPFARRCPPGNVSIVSPIQIDTSRLDSIVSTLRGSLTRTSF